MLASRNRKEHGMIVDIDRAMKSVSGKRPIFHSEADFQHALAWELQSAHPTASIRLERIVQAANEIHVDIIIAKENISAAIEVKYKTRKVTTDINGEYFAVRDHGAQDIGRYDFFKDIRRLEEIVDHQPRWQGVSIFLTNDSSYWAPLPNPDLGYAQFSMAEGRTVEGRLCWGDRSGPGTRKNRESNHELRGRYRLQWSKYSQVPTDRYGEFRYLAVEVHRSS
jgi:hypothetical protein